MTRLALPHRDATGSAASRRCGSTSRRGVGLPDAEGADVSLASCVISGAGGLRGVCPVKKKVGPLFPFFTNRRGVLRNFHGSIFRCLVSSYRIGVLVSYLL
jgi:hypothetical protein